MKTRNLAWFLKTLGICIGRAVRFAFRPDFRVCRYQQVDGREIIESGVFAATGTTQDECYDDAKAHLQRNHSGSFEFYCRLPFPWEAWGRFRDLLCGYSNYPLRGDKPIPENEIDRDMPCPACGKDRRVELICQGEDFEYVCQNPTCDTFGERVYTGPRGDASAVQGKGGE